MADIYTALAAVMRDCDHVAKRDRNEHQRFMFRGIDAVLNAVGPVLRKHDVIVVPSVEDTIYDQVTTTNNKAATACRVTVTYTFFATDGSSVPVRVVGEAWDHGDKATPKAMSVAFRTALLQALALPTDEADPDSQTYEAKAPARPRKQAQPRQPKAETGEAISEPQLKKIGALMREAGMTDRQAALDYVAGVIGRDIESRNDLSKNEASRVIEALSKRAAPPDDNDQEPEGWR